MFLKGKCYRWGTEKFKVDQTEYWCKCYTIVTARRDGIVILNSVVIIHKRKLNNKNRLLCFLAVLSFRSIDSRPKIQAETTVTLLINCFLPW